jgi:hypothetical protein
MLEETIKEFIGAVTGWDLEARDKHQEVFPLTPAQRKQLLKERSEKLEEDAHKRRMEDVMESEGLDEEAADERVRQNYEQARKEADEYDGVMVIPSPPPPKKSWWDSLFD